MGRIWSVFSVAKKKTGGACTQLEFAQVVHCTILGGPRGAHLPQWLLSFLTDEPTSPLFYFFTSPSLPTQQISDLCLCLSTGPDFTRSSMASNCLKQKIPQNQSKRQAKPLALIFRVLCGDIGPGWAPSKRGPDKRIHQVRYIEWQELRSQSLVPLSFDAFYFQRLSIAFQS